MEYVFFIYGFVSGLGIVALIHSISLEKQINKRLDEQAEELSYVEKDVIELYTKMKDKS